jgi:hypothetical protein
MPSHLTDIITSQDPAVRDSSLDAFCRGASLDTLIAESEALERFRRRSDNLYERVRALFFLSAIHRFHVPAKLAPAGNGAGGAIPFAGYEHLLNRRFEEAVEAFLDVQRAHGPGDAISSALAAAYHDLGFQTLANQVRRSVRSVRGNQWMFRTGTPPTTRSASGASCWSAPPPTARSRSCRRRRRCGWTSPTARGATSSSSGWTTPRARAC